jgi:hypothetical protein
MNKFCVSAAVLSASALLFSCGGGAVTLPDTPDGTAATVIQEINKGNPRAVWDAMPASYQKDVTDIVHSFGKQMDAEVMSETMGLLDQVVGLLGSKKELVLGMAKEPMGKQYAMIEKNFDNILALAKSVIGSDAMDANKLASLDVGSFLGGEGAEIFGKFKAIAPMMERDNPFPMFAKMSFKAGEAKDGMVPVQMLDRRQGGRPPRELQKGRGALDPGRDGRGLAQDDRRGQEGDRQDQDQARGQEGDPRGHQEGQGAARHLRKREHARGLPEGSYGGDEAGHGADGPAAENGRAAASLRHDSAALSPRDLFDGDQIGGIR